jgi:protein-disulfide isomerase
MHDLLFENQHSLELSELPSYAEMLDLDVRRFVAEMKNHRFLGRVRRNFMDGIRSGVNGTPTFFINGIRHDGAWTLPGLLEAIEGGGEAYPY